MVYYAILLLKKNFIEVFTVSKLKVGIIGLGGICLHAHMPAYLKMDNVEVAAICDILPEKIDNFKKQYNIIMLYTIQLTMSTNNRLWIDSSCLSQSKQIVEILENLFLIRNMELEENIKKLLITVLSIKK